MQSEKPAIPKRMADASSYEVDPGKGWVLFAGVMLGVVGVLNLIAGIAAIDNAQFYVRDVQFVFADLKTFGWILTVLGALQLLVSFGIFRNSDAARWAGIALAAVNMCSHFFFLTAYPFGAVMVFFVDVIIIWGLMMYGGSDRRSLQG
jgi:hypothetical protein